MKSLKCKFDWHDWIDNETHMERICKRCKISIPKYIKRNSGSVWFCSLRVIRSSFSCLWKYLRGSDKKYLSKGKIDPFYVLSKWTIVGRVTWKLLCFISILLILLKLIGLAVNYILVVFIP